VRVRKCNCNGMTKNSTMLVIQIMMASEQVSMEASMLGVAAMQPSDVRDTNAVRRVDN
jgi:hypothetical protein